MSELQAMNNGIVVSAITALNDSDMRKVASAILKDFRADTIRTDYGDNHAVYVQSEFYVDRKTKGFWVYSPKEIEGKIQPSKVRVVYSMDDLLPTDMLMIKHTRYAYVRKTFNFGQISGETLNKSAISEDRTIFYTAHRGNENIVLEKNGSGDDVTFNTSAEFFNRPNETASLMGLVSRFVKRIASNQPVVNARVGAYQGKITLYGNFLLSKNRADKSLKVLAETVASAIKASESQYLDYDDAYEAAQSAYDAMMIDSPEIGVADEI